MEIQAKVFVYRVDPTKKGDWVMCRSLVTLAGDDAPQNCTILRESKEAFVAGTEYRGTFAVREDKENGGLLLRLLKAESSVAVRKAA